MASSFVLSYWDLTDAATGGARRIHALLNTLGASSVLVQPRRHHPRFATVPFPTDFGRTKVGINWGMFNFMWPGTRRIACGAISAHRPALLVMTSIWCAPIASRFPDIPCVLDAHDVNALAVGERFGDRHPFTRMVHRQEARAVALARHVFCCSDPDRDAFIRLYGLDPENVILVPNGVDVDGFPHAGPTGELDTFWREHLAGHTVLLFMGKLDYQPNAAALAFLGDSLLPELEKRAPGRFRLLVTGGPVPPGPHPPSMIYAGRLPIDRLREYMVRADLCLAPVFTGGGTRLKVLEYMAAGRPVIATPKGAEGISCTNGTHLVIAETGSFADQVIALDSDREQARQMGLAAHAFVRDHYDWSRSIRPHWRQVFDRYLAPDIS